MAENGTVRWFNNQKGYGFIQKESDGKDIFVHYSAITMEGYKTLKTNDKVTFDVVQGEKGPQVANVVADSSDTDTSDSKE